MCLYNKTKQKVVQNIAVQLIKSLTKLCFIDNGIFEREKPSLEPQPGQEVQKMRLSRNTCVVCIKKWPAWYCRSDLMIVVPFGLITSQPLSVGDNSADTCRLDTKSEILALLLS